MGLCRVPDCNGVTEYDDNAQAVLCTTCGTVITQHVLTHEWDGELSGSQLYFGPTTLKSLRRVGGGLAGQSGKEDRDRRNTTAMHQYILGVLTKLTWPGLTARADTLFDQARVRGKYRWGKKAVLVAGACIAVVLRESKKGVTMSHLASLIDISPHALCRMFTHVCSLLNLQIPHLDPLSILPTLQSHLMIISTSPTPTLPKVLINILRTLPPAPVLHLASSLATLLDDLDDFSPLGPSVCPTACALLLLALEGQAASSLPSYTTLAQELSAKVGTRKDLVTRRYGDISKVLEDWMADVPWLSKADDPDNRLGKRRKASQRDVIARGIKDVVQFREEIHVARKRRKSQTPVTVALEVAEEESDDNADSPPTRKRKRSEKSVCSPSSTSIRLIRSRQAKPPLSPMDLASLSLISPLHPLSSDCPLSSRSSERALSVDTLQNQILTSSNFPTELPPTRLQRLVALRGGESEIKDDELFEADELEGFLRSEDEVATLRSLLGWNELGPSAATHSFTPPLPQDFGWDLADMAVWEEMESGKEADCQPDEQILGQWREASPGPGDHLEEHNNFDVSGEW